MAAMGAESTPIVAARATIRNMDRIAWMKGAPSKCTRATVARSRARPLLRMWCSFLVQHPVQLALVPRRASQHSPWAWIFAKAVTLFINPDVRISLVYYSRILCHFCHEMMGPVRKCMGISQIRRE